MDDYPIIVSQALSDKAIANLYDYSALFAKGLLLNADTEVSKIIEHSGDKKLISEYESIKEMKGVLLKIQENPTEQAKLIADSLSTLINKREVDLIGRSKAYGDFTRNLNITWRDVQKGLGNDDVAVEFLSFLSGDERNYVALTLTKDDACPQFTQLSFRDKDLKALNANELFNSDKIYEMVWKPLLSRIGGKKRIYFSPSGALYNIAIEFAPHMENYQLYRLSSTRVLAQKNSKKVTVNPKVVLYGNLMYDAEPKELVDANNRNGYDFNRGFNVVKNSLNAELLHVRSGFGILNNTGFEVNNIADELSAHKISCVKLTGVNGTEESFKSLSGKKFAVIHLATHGMYISDLHVNQMRNDHNMQFLHLDNYRSKVFSQPKEDVSMTHSFLVMSGGNMLINGDKIPEGMDDGILTAQEIAGVDLRGCDLVVMSACDTGLGDISSEGVMGLQRGFKKAGAKTIIMSLNEVPDKPTMEFMTLFYDALTAGKSKYEAFTHARLTMKAKYPAPDQYQYWASFILLDGIDGIE